MNEEQIPNGWLKEFLIDRFYIVIFVWFTLPKLNMEPENGTLE